jgi:hypothetical protein
MFIALHKKLLWVIVIWFAILQTVSPFIHAHLEADSPAQGYGLHLHDEGLLQMSGNEHVLTAHPTHAVGINVAVVEDVDPLPSPLFSLLFVISLFVFTISLAGINLIKHPFPQPYLRSISRPRAPPLF